MHTGKYFAKETYFDRLFNAQAVKILPGEYHASGDNTIITTVLGSCVSVCIFDTRSGVGGMNHFMLPGDTGIKSSRNHGSARYGVHAMELLLEHVLRLGASRSNLTAKVFGAGKVIDNMGDVGSRNSSFAIRYLKEMGINVHALDVGSVYPRKIYFFPATGRVLVKRIRPQAMAVDTLPLPYQTVGAPATAAAIETTG